MHTTRTAMHTWVLVHTYCGAYIHGTRYKLQYTVWHRLTPLSDSRVLSAYEYEYDVVYVMPGL